MEGGSELGSSGSSIRSMTKQCGYGKNEYDKVRIIAWKLRLGVFNLEVVRTSKGPGHRSLNALNCLKFLNLGYEPVISKERQILIFDS